MRLPLERGGTLTEKCDPYKPANRGHSIVRSVIKIVLSLLVLAALILLVVAWNGIVDIWEWSTGAPRSLSFRSTIEWDGTKPVRSTRIREWRLEIPQQFIVRKDGYRSTYYDLAGDRLSFVSILSRLNDRDEVVPDKGGAAGAQAFTITLRNSLVDRQYADKDYCLTAYQLTSSGRTPACVGQPNCRVHLNYYGWPAEISVSQHEALFKNPDRVCEIARSTLTAWTKSIDDLRVTKLRNGATR